MTRGPLVPLLLAALLLGARPPAAVVHPMSGDPVEAVSAVDAITVGPALPGTAAASSPTPDAAFHLRAGGHGRTVGNPPGLRRGAVERCRAAQLERVYLRYVRVLKRACFSPPITCSKPPPVSFV